MEMHAPKLDKRLMTAARLVRRGSVVADVGCDHGKLSAWLAMSGVSSRIYASDIGEKPLRKARILVDELNLGDRITLIHASGIPCADAEDIVIAGLGPDVILSVIDDAPFVRDPSKRLILVPASHPERVRAGLYLRGFRLLHDIPVEVRGMIYAVMNAEYCGDEIQVSSVFAELGLIDPSDDHGRRYYMHIKKKYELILSNIQNSSDGLNSTVATDARMILEHIDSTLEKEVGI